MKRSGPPQRRTPMKRTAMPRDPTGRPLRPVSIRRRQQWGKRSEVRQEVIRRAHGRCQGIDVVPEVRCGYYPPERPWLEVDELRGGAQRVTEWLDPDQCQALCPAHHDWKTDHKRDYLDRLAGRPPKENPDG